MSEPPRTPPAGGDIVSRWRFWAFIIGFYGLALTFAVTSALKAQSAGLPTFVAILYGALTGVLASYFIFHYTRRLLTWVCGLLKRPSNRSLAGTAPNKAIK